MADPSLAEAPPRSDGVTPYDHAHRITYLRLLDAAEDGADWREVASLVLELDPAADPERTRRIYETHLARARWMTEHGYRDLLQHGIPCDSGNPRSS